MATAKKSTTKKAPTKKAAIKKSSEPTLHYDKNALLEEYQNTYRIALWTVGSIIGFALLYFFVLATYLGGWAHTKHEPFFKKFGEDVDIEYDGLKLPMYENGGE